MILTALGFLESFVFTGVLFPSLLLYLLAVFLFLEGISSLFIITTFAYVGSFIGDQSSYLIGRFYGVKFLNLKFFQKRKLTITKTKNWFDKYEFGAILLGRMTPSIRPFAPFMVGTFKLNYKRFLIFDLLACAIWGLGLVLLVVLWDSIANFF